MKPGREAGEVRWLPALIYSPDNMATWKNKISLLVFSYSYSLHSLMKHFIAFIYSVEILYLHAAMKFPVCRQHAYSVQFVIFWKFIQESLQLNILQRTAPFQLIYTYSGSKILGALQFIKILAQLAFMICGYMYGIAPELSRR